MNNKISELSVFFPAVNEEESIEKTVIPAAEVLEKVANNWEIIIIDDGSIDSTGQISDNLSKSDSRIKVVHHKSNRGYGGALKSGFKNAKYKWVCFTDSDGQFDFSEVTKFIEKTEEADLILGYRLNRADSFLRKVFTFGWSLLARVLLGFTAKDYSCGFKLIKKEVFERVQPLVGEEKVTQIEMLVKAKRLGYKFTEIGVHHYPRKYGMATGAKVSVAFRSIVELFKLWRKLK